MSCQEPAASRAEAIEKGLIRFSNGVRCPAGHITERYTLSSHCVECSRLNTEMQRLKVKAKRAAARPEARP